jgi:hypothetical protein
MTKEIYDRSVETGEVQLVGFWDKSAHFGIVGFLLFLATVVVCVEWNLQKNNINIFQSVDLWMIIAPLTLALIFYLVQKQRLKFRVVKTKLNHAQLKEILTEVAEMLEWKFTSMTTNVCIATTNPGFFSGSWGEQITILFYQDSVFVNSICDPDKRSSVVSFGRNRENERTLIDKINEAGNKLTVT